MISDTYHTRVIVDGAEIFHQENPNPQEYYDCYMFTSGADDSKGHKCLVLKIRTSKFLN